MISSLNYNWFTQYIIKKESPSFEQFLVREKQIEWYIQFFIIIHNNLEYKIILVQNFISLAYSLKIFNNPKLLEIEKMINNIFKINYYPDNEYDNYMNLFMVLDYVDEFLKKYDSNSESKDRIPRFAKFL